MSGRRIVLVEAADRRRLVLALTRAAATTELVADWAEQASSTARVHVPVAPERGGIHLPSLRDFVGDQTAG